MFYWITSKFNVNINESGPVQREILSFSDQNPGYDYHVDSPLDSTYGAADAGDDSLQNFFSRPIKIQSYGWGTGTNLFESFNPWQDFWENDRVINRISNYNLLRCKLCVKIILNGNGFHYGRAIASYLPLPEDDEFTLDRAFFRQDIIAASQRPHIYLDPTNSQGGTLCLPFVWKRNALSIPDQEWRQMGKMIIHGMQDLKHANGASDSVTVSVFAWAEDVVISTPTSSEPGALAPQSGPYVPQADEYQQSPISTPANYIARAAGALSKAPVIGAYAKATEIAAGAVANVAKIFGYSRPVYAGEIQPYKPTYLGNMANTNVPDTSNKLTLDVKQETTIDTRTMGLDGTDELEIRSIATRESYLASFPWAVASPTESLLWNSHVTPMMYDTNGDEIHMTAACYASLPFKYWRGSMKYRFQIVASSFHKGRLKVVYDPYYAVTNEYNTNYTRIIDLAEERDFTVEIGWGQPHPYLARESIITGQTNFSETKLGNKTFGTHNGMISIYVVNELTVPNSTADNDIEVNVFVSAGDDIEYASPTDMDWDRLSWFPQAGEYTPQSGNVPDADETIEENAPMQTVVEEHMAAPALVETDHTNDIYFGDPIVSFRQLMKRYNFQGIACSSSGLGPSLRLIESFRSNFPYYRGNNPDGEHEGDNAGTAVPYQYSIQTYLNYFTPAFVCRRGGIRWKYQLVTDQERRGKQVFAISRECTAGDTGSQEYLIPDDSTDRNFIANTFSMKFASLAAGGYATAAEQNPVIEAEFPYYLPKRFLPAKQAYFSGFNPVQDEVFHKLNWLEWTASGCRNFILGYTAAAEDFNLGWYTGPPVLYVHQPLDPYLLN